MKNKKILTGFAGIFIAVLAVAGVFAYMGDPSVKGPEYSEERHEAMQNAFDSLDYQSWYELMTLNGRNPRIVEVINEENFAEFAQAHQAAIEGDLSKLKEFRESLGLGLGQMKHRNGKAFARGFGRGFEQGQRSGNCPNLE